MHLPTLGDQGKISRATTWLFNILSVILLEFENKTIAV